MTAPLPAPIRRLWSAVFCGYLALGATLQELPGYVSHRFDAGPVTVGTTVGIAFAGTAVGRPFAGRAGDAGRSRTVAGLGAGLTALAALGHLLAPDLALLITARVAMGLGEAALFSGTLPWILNTVPRDRVGRTAGWFGLSMWGGLAIGPLVAVAAHAAGGSTSVWALVILLPGMSGTLIASIRTAQPRRPPAHSPGTPASLLLGTGSAGVVLGAAAYGYGTLTALLVLFLSRSSIGGQDVALSLYSASFLLSRFIGSPAVDRYGGVRVAGTMLVVGTCGLVGLDQASSRATALAAVAVIGIGLGPVYPATSRMTLARLDPAVAGAAMGIMTSFWDLGILVAGPVSGLFAAHFGVRTAFLLAGGVVIAPLAIIVQRFDRTGRPSSTRARSPSPGRPYG